MTNEQWNSLVIFRLWESIFPSVWQKICVYPAWSCQERQLVCLLYLTMHRGPRGINLTKKFLSIFFILHWDKKFQKCLYCPSFHFQIGEGVFFHFTWKPQGAHLNHINKKVGNFHDLSSKLGPVSKHLEAFCKSRFKDFGKLCEICIFQNLSWQNNDNYIWLVFTFMMIVCIAVFLASWKNIFWA